MTPLGSVGDQRGIIQVARRTGHSHLVRIAMKIIPQRVSAVAVHRPVKADFGGSWQPRRNWVACRRQSGGIILGHECRGQTARAGRGHPSGPGQVPIGEIQRCMSHMRAEIIIPTGGTVGGCNNFLCHGQPKILKGGKGHRHIIMPCQRLYERYGILHREPGPRPDGKMRTMRRIT